MKFVINGLKYDTKKMEKMTEFQNFTLWRTKKGNWLLTQKNILTSKIYVEAIYEDKAKELLSKYNVDKYEELYGEIPEA